MKSELLLRIKDAETAATEKVDAAEAQAHKILTQARREAERVLTEGRAQADAAYADRMAEVRAAAEEEGKKILSNGKRTATNLRKKFDAGIDGVTDRVLKLFEESL